MTSKSIRFRDLHYRDHPLLLPNAWDVASAALLAAQGFSAVGTTSLGVAAGAGLADGVGATQDETFRLAMRLAPLTVPVTVDIEGGFSTDPEEVAEFAWHLGELGIAGINLEDGRADVRLAEPGAQAELIAAVKARVPELFVNARVDTHWLGLAEDSTFDRIAAYEKAGADGIFVPGITAPEQIRAVTESTTLPVNILATGTPVADLAALGVRRISTGSLLYRSALAATVRTAVALRDGAALPGDIPGYRELRTPRVGHGIGPELQ
ncbi:isocitrate lyase/phosphoenolpyruvate mutase family protein [Nocardia sp. NPDC127579]|uniref:isocitrate lyase/PEP mutase family protein n=1 Tax=Nocardia sp. NPDC127579 TaxID=3345402 RepID=UPI003636647C